MQLTILDGKALNPGDITWEEFTKYADVRVYEQTKESEVISHIGSSDAILLNKINITSDVISQCPNLKYIGVLATGYNVIDLDATNKANICVTNIPSYSTMAVAQHTFALMMQFSNQIEIHNASIRNGEWIDRDCFCYWKTPLIELYNKTLGIIGYGNIGKQVEKIAKAFGMNVLICPHKFNSNIENCVTMQELLAKSDFISLHTPLTEETKQMINKDSISQMKDGVFIINTARGGLVNELDVKEALINKKIAGYAADVVANEPMNKDCPLLNVENCILTPHIAWAPLETRKRLMNIALDNFCSWLNNSPKTEYHSTKLLLEMYIHFNYN